jgi:hypothetical protein
MSIWTIALSILATVIVVVDYRRLAACTRRQGRHGRDASLPAAIAGLMPEASAVRERAIR